MRINDILSGVGTKAMVKLYRAAKEKYGEKLKSATVADFGENFVKGKIVLEDGSKHRMTVRF